ncbi:hypothetical protein [Zunongwangia pacifica]|uniref:Uncharacterized protein n=1 Tax=Zunongwangia pacifica TaxID=2911062 RepID=A0A9X2CQR6_9FLAO|nr:hypothetical protein [Zunongwangia pacifica]MCL6220278.1 hypothetical protein [Zunongwangia pacifica]
MDILINLTINEKDKMERFINRDVLTEIETNKLIERWFSIFNSDKKYTVNSYGFIKNKINLNHQYFDIIELYIQYDEISKREFLKLSFKSNLVIDVEKE